MKQAARTVIVGLVAGIGGIVVSSLAVSWFFGSLMTQAALAQSRANIITRVAVLGMLRDGQTANAIENLEIMLDGDVIGLRPYLLQNKPGQKQALDAARTASTYRSTVSYESPQPEVRGAVREVLTIAAQRSQK